MPIKQSALLAGIVFFFCSVVAFSYFFGPMQRSFATRPRVLSVESTEQIIQAWEQSGVKGRIAICFTRYLNALETIDSKAAKATELAMNHGLVRKVFHVTPDSAWPEINGTLANRNDMRHTPEGFIGIFNDGRVYIMPLSRFSPVAEKALILVEPNIWSHDELKQIIGMLQSGKIASDLTVIVRGSEEEAAQFRQTLAR